MNKFRKHEAIAIAEKWLKGETSRNPDELVNEQRMAAMLLLAIDEIERMTAELRYQTARAAYFEHDTNCCGGCGVCKRLAAELTVAEKAMAT